jgi:hypothetical protein
MRHGRHGPGSRPGHPRAMRRAAPKPAALISARMQGLIDRGTRLDKGQRRFCPWGRSE